MTLPDFDAVFKQETHRLRGITSWDDVAHIGNLNIERLLQRARESANAGMASGDDASDLRQIKAAIDYMETCLVAAEAKPLFPRLRVESFRKGDAVRVYLGDTPETVTSELWIPATITAQDKAFRTDWNDGSASGGYFWRWTATADSPVFAGQNFVRFSTSEPRVLKAWEYDYLRGNSDSAFTTIFAANAYRTWQPLWCLERNIMIADPKIEGENWLRHERDVV